MQEEKLTSTPWGYSADIYHRYGIMAGTDAIPDVWQPKPGSAVKLLATYTVVINSEGQGSRRRIEKGMNELASETLTETELTAITGYSRPTEQRRWLDSERWVYHKNRAGHPVVGRIYARMRMAGIAPKSAPADAWSLDLSRVF